MYLLDNKVFDIIDVRRNHERLDSVKCMSIIA